MRKVMLIVKLQLYKLYFMSQKVHYYDLGKIDYAEAWDIQSELQQKLVLQKRENRDNPLYTTNHYFLFCEHNPVYTLGKSGKMDNLLLNKEQLKDNSVEFYKVNRGGDITYHGPGQVVGYPIFDLDFFFTDIHKYVRTIEEGIIQLLKLYNLDATRYSGFTGVWLPPDKKIPFWRKICAIGVHLSRWVTMHGFALNVNTDLKYFNNIVPCGINDSDKVVTSISNELQQDINYSEVKDKLIEIYSKLFDFEIDTSDNYIKKTIINNRFEKRHS